MKLPLDCTDFNAEEVVEAEFKRDSFKSYAEASRRDPPVTSPSELWRTAI